MKQILALLIIFPLLLCACGNNEESDGNPQTNQGDIIIIGGSDSSYDDLIYAEGYNDNSGLPKPFVLKPQGGAEVLFIPTAYNVALGYTAKMVVINNNDKIIKLIATHVPSLTILISNMEIWDYSHSQAGEKLIGEPGDMIEFTIYQGLWDWALSLINYGNSITSRVQIPPPAYSQ